MLCMVHLHSPLWESIKVCVSRHLCCNCEHNEMSLVYEIMLNIVIFTFSYVLVMLDTMISHCFQWQNM